WSWGRAPRPRSRTSREPYRPRPRVRWARRSARVARVFSSSPPVLLLFPAPLAARAGFLHAQVELLDVVLLPQTLAGVFHHDASVFQDVAMVGGVERHV